MDNSKLMKLISNYERLLGAIKNNHMYKTSREQGFYEGEIKMLEDVILDLKIYL